MKLADVFAKKKAKEVTPKQEKVRTILNWVMTILCIILIVFALVVAIFTIVRSTNGLNLTAFGNNIYMNVASDSMEPTFSTNDIIITKRYDGDGMDLKVGQVITFSAVINGYQAYNTHRIIYIGYRDGKVDFIKTRGDNIKDEDGNIIPWQNSLAPEGYEASSGYTGPDGTWDSWVVSINNINSSQTWSRNSLVATWGSVDENGNFQKGKMLKGVGAFANWIQDNEHGKTRFFCVIVLPLIILFIAYAFVLVRTLVIAKLENNKKVQGEPVRDVDSMSDEEKRRLAQELLASLGGAAIATPPTDKPAQEAQNADAPTDEVATESEAANANAAQSADETSGDEGGTHSAQPSEDGKDADDNE